MNIVYCGTMKKGIKRSVLKKVVRHKLKTDEQWARMIMDKAVLHTINVHHFLTNIGAHRFERVWKTVLFYIYHYDNHEMALLKAYALKNGFVKAKDVRRALVDATSSMI